MEQLLQHFHNDADAVCQALGVSKREFNLSVRTLVLVDTYKESDYGDQLQSDQYSLFREILKSEPMRAWLGWDHIAFAASSQSNLNLLFSVDVPRRANRMTETKTVKMWTSRQRPIPSLPP